MLKQLPEQYETVNINLQRLKEISKIAISQTNLAMTKCLGTCEVTANWREVAVNPAWSTVISWTYRIRVGVAFDMTPVWKSASQIPAFIQTILDTMKRISVATQVPPNNCKEIDQGSKWFNVELPVLLFTEVIFILYSMVVTTFFRNWQGVRKPF